MLNSPLLRAIVVAALTFASACTPGVPCAKNSDCADGQVCAASTDGTFCIAAGNEGEGEGELQPSAELRLEAGQTEGDEYLDVTIAWTLVDVTDCVLVATEVSVQVSLTSQTSAGIRLEESGTLQVVCDQASSASLHFTVHDVSEIDGPRAVAAGATATFTFNSVGVSECSVATSGSSAALTQPVIVSDIGTFTDVGDADKSYTLTCAGSLGPIVRTADLLILTVTEVIPPPDIVNFGDDVTLTVAVDQTATCALWSSAPDGTGQRAEAAATAEVAGDQRTLTLGNAGAVRAYWVECSIDDAAARSEPALVQIRPTIVSFDAFIPSIEVFNVDANLELVIDVLGLEAGGSCTVSDGAADIPVVGGNLTVESGPVLATYTLRCSAPGSDPMPSVVGGFQVLWRDATAADVLVIPTVRFVMGNVSIDNLTVTVIDTGLLEKVAGRLAFSALTPVSGPIAISAPNLNEVGSRLSIEDVASLGSLSIPNLRSAGLVLVWVGGVTSIAAPLLTHASNQFGVEIGYCNDLAAIELPVLRQAGRLSIYENDDLQHLSLPALEELTNASGVYLDSIALTTLDLPLLDFVNGDVSISRVGLSSLVLPALWNIAGHLYVFDNPDLASVSFAALTDIGSGPASSSIIFLNNDALTQINTPTLLNTDPSGSFSVTGNATLSCTEVNDLYCPLAARNSTPTISNNLSSNCPGIDSSC